MALYMNAAGELFNAEQLAEDEAISYGASFGSWRVTGTGAFTHSSAVIANESFRTSYILQGLQPSAKFVTQSGTIVNATPVPPPNFWYVETPDGEHSTLTDAEFQASHTVLADATDTKYTNAAGEAFDAAQLSNVAADAKGVEHGSWHLIDANGKESTLSDKEFQAGYTKVPAEVASSSSPQSAAQSNTEDKSSSKSNGTDKSSGKSGGDEKSA